MGWLPSVVGLQRGKYFARSAIAYCFLLAVDITYAAFSRTLVHAPAPTQSPQRLLLCNGAHLGDVLLMLSVLPALKRKWPNIEIGVLVGSWSKSVVEGHPDISNVHYVDHWKLNRSARPVWAKIIRYLSTRRKAIGAIRSVDYDVAVDCYFFFPNAAMLLSQAGIPARLGYSSGGFSGYFSHSLNWSPKHQSVVQYHLDLLAVLSPDLSDAIPDPRAGVMAASSGSSSEGTAVSMFFPEPGYILLHPGAGDSVKEWPTESWREIIRRLLAAGHRLVVTGSGERECARVNEILSEFQGIQNLCGRLEWSEFVHVVRRARMLVGADSSPAHVAAAVDILCLVIPTGMNDPCLWRPLGGKCRYLQVNVPCAPCYLKRGCENMACIREITPRQVMTVMESLLT